MDAVRWLVLFGICLGTSRQVSGLKCASCIHLDLLDSPPQGFPNIYRNVHCQDFNHKVLSDNFMDCPEDSAHVCATVKGVYTFGPLTADELRVNATLRRCLPQPQGFNGNAEASICLNGDESVSGVELIGAADDFGDRLSFKGNVCYCNGDNCNGASSDVRGGVATAFVIGILVSMAMAF